MFAYIIYFNTIDFPKKYVVRKFEIQTLNLLAREIIFEGKTLFHARKSIPFKCVCFQRNPEDDKHIIETWI